ncbi:hypothetical protein QY886_05450 [Latilactobacillus sakei]
MAAIATQKAGIIKAQHPVVIGKLPAEAQTVIVETAKRLASPLAISGVDFSTTAVKTLPTWGQQLNFQNQTVTLKQLQIPLMGDYQIENACSSVRNLLSVSSVDAAAA